jgi:hypothetical protein
MRVHLAVLDPDPYWECGSGSRGMEIDCIYCISKRHLYLRRHVFVLPITSFTYRYIFHVKI